MGFPVVMYGCESWTIKAEHWRIDAFELWCWGRLLRVSWTARRSNQSLLKEISPGCSLEGLMLEAEAPILWPPDVKSWLIWKDPYAGKDWGQKKGMKEDEMVGWHHWLNGHEVGWTPGAGDGQGGLHAGVLWFTGSQRVGHDWATELTDPKSPSVGETDKECLHSLSSTVKILFPTKQFGSSGCYAGDNNMESWCQLGIDTMNSFLKHTTERQVEVETNLLIHILNINLGNSKIRSLHVQVFFFLNTTKTF